MARGAARAARCLHEPQPISDQSIGVGFPHSAGWYRPGGSLFSSLVCCSCRFISGFLVRGRLLIPPGCGGTLTLARGATHTKDAHFFTWTQTFPGNSLFQLFLKISNTSSYSRKKASFWGGGGATDITPRWSVHYIKHGCTIRSDLRAVIFGHFHSTQRWQGRLRVPKLCSSVSVDFSLVHALVGFVL